jgi:hypothetical protein
LKLSGQMQENKQAPNYEGNSHAQLATRTAGLVHFHFEKHNSTKVP